MRLTFADFLEVLAALAPRLRPYADRDFAFRQILLENVLPLAKRRVVTNVDAELADPEVDALLRKTFCRGFGAAARYPTARRSGTPTSAEMSLSLFQERATLPRKENGYRAGSTTSFRSSPKPRTGREQNCTVRSRCIFFISSVERVSS